MLAAENINKLEGVQRRSVRFVCNKYSRKESVTSMLDDLEGPPLQQRRAESRLVLFHRIVNGTVGIDSAVLMKESRRPSRKRAIAASLAVRTFCKTEPHNDGHVVICFPDIGTEISWTIAQIEAAVKLPVCDPTSPKSPSAELLASLFKIAGIPQDTHDTKSLAIIAFLYLFCSLGYKNGALLSFKGYLASSLPTSAGLGSSAAFSTCLASCLLMLQGIIHVPEHSAATHIGAWTESKDLLIINKWAFEAEKIIHGKPSGIDNSVSTYGGALRFQDGKITPLKKIPELRILLTSTKQSRSTKKLVGQVRELVEEHPTIVKPILDSMEATATKCEEILEKMYDDGRTQAQYLLLEDLIDINQSLLAAIGVNHPLLEQICVTTMKHGFHSKLTGAGGGGCTFTLIPHDTDQATLDKLEIELTDLGFDCWETTIGGAGVLSHSSNLNNYRLPQGFVST